MTAEEKKYLDEISRKLDLIIRRFNIDQTETVSDRSRADIEKLVDIKVLRSQNRMKKECGSRERKKT